MRPSTSAEMGTRWPSRCSSRAASSTASSESPPATKKSLSGPRSGWSSTARHASTMAATTDDAPTTEAGRRLRSGGGNARRSTLPCSVRASAGTSSITEGTAAAGRRVRNDARNVSGSSPSPST
ncbi:MAG: hypothetical protein R2755_17655 [Acidimicrobiales bacterium]